MSNHSAFTTNLATKSGRGLPQTKTLTRNFEPVSNF